MGVAREGEVAAAPNRGGGERSSRGPAPGARLAKERPGAQPHKQIPASWTNGPGGRDPREKEYIPCGNTDIKNGITYSKFETVPDQPVSSFELKLPESLHSILGTNLPTKDGYDLCGQALIMPTTITGQNGAQVKPNTTIAVTGCPKAKKAKKASKARKARASGHKQRHRRKGRKANMSQRRRGEGR